MKRVISKFPIIINILAVLHWGYIVDFYWYELGRWLDSKQWRAFSYQEGCMNIDYRASALSVVVMPALYIVTILLILLMSRIFQDVSDRRTYLKRSLLIVTVADVLIAFTLFKERLPELIEFVERYGSGL